MASPAQTPHFYPPKYDQSSGYYSAPPFMSLPLSSGYHDTHASMTLPSDQPTSEKIIMSSSCTKVQACYKEITAKQEEYEACQGPYIGNLENEDFFKWGPQRVKRLEIEGQFLTLALEVRKLHGQHARGVEFLKEKICDIAPTIIAAIDVDIAHLEHCLGKSSSSQLRDEHASLVRRVKQLAAMGKIFGTSEFTLSTGRVCSFPSGATMLNYKVKALEHKLPDSAVARGLKSLIGAFTPSRRDTSAADKAVHVKVRAFQAPSSSRLEKMQDLTRAQDMTNMTFTAQRITYNWMR